MEKEREEILENIYSKNDIQESNYVNNNNHLKQKEAFKQTSVLTNFKAMCQDVNNWNDIPLSPGPKIMHVFVNNDRCYISAILVLMLLFFIQSLKCTKGESHKALSGLPEISDVLREVRAIKSICQNIQKENRVLRS